MTTNTWDYVPDGVTLLWTRYRTEQRFEPISVDMVASYGDLDVIADAARTLKITRPDSVIFCCNSCSFVHGMKVDERIRQVVESETGASATSITYAEVQALRRLDVKRVAVAAPYPAEVTARLVAFLENEGFSVLGALSLGLTTEWQIGNTPPEYWLDVAMRVNVPEAEAVLLACGGIRTSSIHAETEKRLGKPLISAPAVAAWHGLRLADVHQPLSGKGVLLERY